jgi:phenylpropionate dioxygenase-like ring-hydroxylating dioxygenase large terminal subunit
MIPNDAYYRQDLFEQEMERLFATGWAFVGHRSELANDKDFICLEHWGCSIVVQNFKGELKAFKNVCTHRFNQIQFEPKGNRPFTCRYHGWTFNSQGQPIGAAGRVADAENVLHSLCLTPYRIEACGDFIFVARERATETLPEYLGGFYAILEDLSLHLGQSIYFNHVPHQANWKVLVENVIDNSHCALLHKESFVSFGFCRNPVEDVKIDGLHSSWHVPRSALPRDGLRNRALSHLKNRGFSHDSFYHLYIWPNLFLASTEGISFYVGQALPISPDQTQLRVRYFEPKVDLKPSERQRQDLLNEQTRVYGLDVVEEDRPILESIQRNVRLADGPGAMVKGEPRIAAFMSSYEQAMA